MLYFIKYFIKTIPGFCLLILLFSGVYAKTDIFIPDINERVSDISWGKTKASRVSNVFFNPAATIIDKELEVQIAHSQHGWDYNSYLFSGLINIDNWIIGFGYDYYFSDTIPEVKNDGYLPYISRYFEDKYQTFKTTIAHSISSDLSLGISLKAFGRELYDSKAMGYSGDVGFILKNFDPYFFGVYTNNLIQSPLRWSSGHTESLPSELVFEGIADFDLFLFQCSTFLSEGGLEKSALGGELFFHEDLSLSGRLFLSDNLSLYQYSIGTNLRFQKFLLRYTFSKKDKNGLEQEEHHFGISALFDVIGEPKGG